MAGRESTPRIANHPSGSISRRRRRRNNDNISMSSNDSCVSDEASVTTTSSNDNVEADGDDISKVLNGTSSSLAKIVNNGDDEFEAHQVDIIKNQSQPQDVDNVNSTGDTEQPKGSGMDHSIDVDDNNDKDKALSVNERQQKHHTKLEDDKKTTKRKFKSSRNQKRMKKNRKKQYQKDSKQKSHKKPPHRAKTRKVSIASAIDNDDENDTQPTRVTFPPLPKNQYTTTLRRRAVKKLEDNTNKLLDDDEKNLILHDIKQSTSNEEYGDTSLGMKLIVVAGKVIVQSLNSLVDGLASPAQLSGVIQRGDVLLGIGNLSLVNLSVDQLMEGLKPLSTPGPGGYYERYLYLRFEAGGGLDLLKAHEEAQKKAASRNEPVDAMFSLFPMVDQLSGVPLFEQHYHASEPKEEDEQNAEESKIDKDQLMDTQNVVDNNGLSETDEEFLVLDLDQLISSTLAKERTVDRIRYQSEYFDWREDLSELLRRTVNIVEEDDDDPYTKKLTQSERLELGKRIMQMTKALEMNIEEIDKGRDLRSFKTWSTNFSLRSGVSARRRYIIETTSVRSSRDTDMDTSHDDESVVSAGSGGSLEGVDADTLLLGLAARDEIWRKQVVDSLNNAVQNMEHIEENGEIKTTERRDAPGIDEALTQELGNFLFGENMSKIVKQEKQSYALPPHEITRVLFDLTTNLATKAPDEITVFGTGSKLSSNISSLQSSTVRTDGKNKTALRADVLLANRFLLDEALPLWLKTFRPLKPEQRRALWPRTLVGTDSMTGTYAGQRSEYTGKSSDGDTLTVDSAGSHTQISLPSKKKDLRELVEDQQLNSETRSETCFLVTYFYTHKVLSDDLNGLPPGIDEETFVSSYGAYLQLHSCLSHAAVMKDQNAILNLLKAAKYDPIHRDAVREIQKLNELMFYDSGKLSAVLEFLVDIIFETKRDRRKLIRDLCVSAYPDIHPWQVRQACLDPPRQDSDSLVSRVPCSDECMEDFYYTYLSNLLNPFDGHDAARHDSALIKEYCEWSVGVQPRPGKNPERLKNFLNIASKSSIQYKRYYRDLMMLLELSLVIDKDDLVLDLADEILETKKLISNSDAMHRVLGCVRKIGTESLVTISNPSKESAGFRILKRVLYLFEKMTNNESATCRKSIVLPDELCSLFQQWKMRFESIRNDTKMYLLIDYIINESSVPEDVLRALDLLSSSNDCGELLFPRLKALLRRGVHFAALKGELSGSLLRLKHARQTFTELELYPSSGQKTKISGGIWDRMAIGSLSVDK